MRRRLRRLRHPWLVGAIAAVLLFTAASSAAGGPAQLLLRAAGAMVSVSLAPTAAGTKAAPLPSGPVTVLVLGTEKTQAFGGTQTDSMMLLAYDKARREAGILSIPRDLWVDIPGYGYQRIDSAYEFGGPSLVETTVAQVVGIHPDYFAVVEYAALQQFVDDLGGIRVYVPYNINDRCYPNPAENACTVFRLSKGWHVLDGADALKFAREREVLPLSDISRESDQQVVLLALRSALLSPWGALHLPSLVGVLRRDVRTNFPLGDVPSLAASVLSLPRSAIHNGVLQYSNGAVSGWYTPGGADVLLPHPTAIHQVVQQVLGPVMGTTT